MHTSGAFFGTMGAPLITLTDSYKKDADLTFVVALVAPSEPGRYSAKWRMALPDGKSNAT